MKKELIVICSCMVMLQSNAYALDGKVGVLSGVSLVGAELEYGSTLRFGGRFLTIPTFSNRYAVWGELNRPLSPDDSVGLIAGLSRDWSAPKSPAIVPSVDLVYGPSPLGYTVGVFYRRQWEKWWIKATPNVCLRFDGYARYTDYLEPLIQGPPWLEVGYRMTPNMEVSFRSALSFFKMAWLF